MCDLHASREVGYDAGMFWTSTALAVTVGVPADHPTPSAALAFVSAEPGDHVIELQGGIYPDATLIMGGTSVATSITVRPVSGASVRLEPEENQAVVVDRGHLRLEGLTVSFQGVRGALVQNDGELTIVDSVLEGAVTGTDGGCLQLENTARVVLERATIQNCRGQDGAGVDVDRNTTLIVVDSTFRANAASAKGGAVRVRGSATFTSVLFDANSAGSQGGAVYLGEESTNPLATISFVGATFTGNTAEGDGGAVTVRNRPVTIESSAFTGNSATGRGGALRTINLGQTTLENTSFAGNSAGQLGGAVYNSQRDLVVRGAAFCGNDAQAFVFTTGDLVGERMLFSDNPEGGLTVLAGAVASISRSTFIGNGVFGLEALAGGSGIAASVVADHPGDSVLGFDRTGMLYGGNLLPPHGGEEVHPLHGVAATNSAPSCDPDSVQLLCGTVGTDGPSAIVGAAGLCTEDADGDGFGAALDCDDADAGRYPGAVEVCDGVDQNCDGTADEDSVDAVSGFQDLDGDGAGSGVLAFGCLGDGVSASNDDCNDRDPRVSPLAVEDCIDPRDNDCDGLFDDDDPDSATLWFADADGDGVGIGNGVLACDQPTGQAAVTGDCDDDDPARTPAADGGPGTCTAPGDRALGWACGTAVIRPPSLLGFIPRRR